MKKTTAFSFFVAAFLLGSQITHAVFTDVSSDHPNFEAIEYLQSHGIVEGYADGSYRPDQRVNRAESLKIILLGSKILVPEIQEREIFPDVPFDTWYGKFVAKAKNLSIVSGDGDTGMFRPGDTVNLAEILKILLKTNNIEAKSTTRNPYADVPAEAWFAPYFGYAFSISLLPQRADENVEPATPVTRGLMAQLMYQLALKPQGYQEGKASYYGAAFHGKGTASGEVFDASLFTAAHRSLPFGTWLRVTNLDNNNETYVRVNDRGPYGDDERIIDLSKAAFEAIAALSTGVVRVSITPVSGPPSEDSGLQTSAVCPDKPALKSYSISTFENITLNASLQNTMLADEVFFLEGKSAGSQPEVSAFLSGPDGGQFAFIGQKKTDGSFSIPIFFPKTGTYQLGVLPGQSGSSVVESIVVLPTSCLAESENTSLPQPGNLSLQTEKGDLVIRWSNDAGHDVTRVSLVQGAKRKDYLIRDKTELRPRYSDFKGWSSGDVRIQLRSAKLNGASLLESQSIVWSAPLSGSLNAVTHEQYTVDTNKVTALGLPDTLSSGSLLTFKVNPKVNLDQWGRIILPNGQVEDVLLESPSHTPMEGSFGIKIFPPSAREVSLRYTPNSNQTHFFEINDEQGIAAVNVPVYPKNSFPLLPNPVDLSDMKPVTLNSDMGLLQREMLQLVNADRAAHGLAPVRLNYALNQLAQLRSDDMVVRNYFGHWNPDGLTANDLRRDFAVAQYVSENIARDVTLPLAEYGLMRSASHRSNILNPEWQRVGFGFTQDGDDGTIFVQIFSDDPIDFSDVPGLRNEIVSSINKERSTGISQEEGINSLAQAWTDKWVSQKWCDLSSTDCNPLTALDGTFTDFLRDSGLSATLGAYYRGDNSFESAKTAFSENPGLKDSRWKKIGIGIKQDNFGIIHFFIVYTE